MDYLPSLNTTIGGFFVILVLFTCLGHRMALPVLFRTEAAAGVELESPDEPPKEENPPRRDPDYYYQATTIVLKVSFLHHVFYWNILTSSAFRSRTHSFAYTKTSCFLSKVLCGREYVSPASQQVQMNGSSDARAIVLDDIPIGEFRALLYYFYHEYVTRFNSPNPSVLSKFGSRRIHSLTPAREVEYLYDLLSIADRTEMSSVRSYAARRLYNLEPQLPPLRRILLYQQFALPHLLWLYPAVVELLERAEPLNLDEAEEAGWELLQKIATLREILAPLRGEDGTFTFTRAHLLQYVSRYFEGYTGRTLVAPLSAHRRITE
jgi:hypothetical protein